MAKHHLYKHLRLLICKISGIVSEAQVFRSRLSHFCVHPGEQALATSMPHTSTNEDFMLATAHPSVSEAVNFLTLLFQNGFSYSSICVARSALPCYLEIHNCEQSGEHTRQKIYEGRSWVETCIPKICSHLRRGFGGTLLKLELLFPPDKSTLKELSYKVIMLNALLPARDATRCTVSLFLVWHDQVINACFCWMYP